MRSVVVHERGCQEEGLVPADYDIETFLRAVGSGNPTPGGGAASAVVAALAAALAEMVAEFTVDKPAYASVDGEMRLVISQTKKLQEELLALIEEDEHGFASVSLAYGLPKTTEEEKTARAATIQQALYTAMQAPLAVMDRGCRVLALALQVAQSGNRRLASDAGCSALLGESAVRAAGLNVLANAVLLQDQAASLQAREQVAHYTRQAAATRRRVMRLVDKALE
jgi:formiminotetrahydrofolate cyclodeaminase